MNDFEFAQQTRLLLMRLFLYLPKQVLSGLLEARKFLFFKYIFNKPIKI